MKIKNRENLKLNNIHYSSTTDERIFEFNLSPNSLFGRDSYFQFHQGANINSAEIGRYQNKEFFPKDHLDKDDLAILQSVGCILKK